MPRSFTTGRYADRLDKSNVCPNTKMYRFIMFAKIRILWVFYEA